MRTPAQPHSGPACLPEVREALGPHRSAHWVASSSPGRGGQSQPSPGGRLRPSSRPHAGQSGDHFPRPGRCSGRPEAGLCLVYCTDVLPEQMGRGSDSLGQFSAFPGAHSSLSHVPSPAPRPVLLRPPKGLLWACPHAARTLPPPARTQRFTLLALAVMKQPQIR